MRMITVFFFPISRNTDNSKEDQEYIQCHSFANEKFNKCLDEQCECYYIQAIRNECIKLCTTYVCFPNGGRKLLTNDIQHHETLYRLSNFCVDLNDFNF